MLSHSQKRRGHEVRSPTCSRRRITNGWWPMQRAETVENDENIDDIILASDTVMVARGDLGVEVVIQSWWVYKNN